ncbi:MAG: radical SAM protein, partial [FCB group bacterium]|nr:radical SAM protein [FCB group bacterium]
PLDELAAETEMLVSQGAKEIILIAQELNSYGQDLDDRPDLPALLKKLTAVEAVEWIRMLYLHPPLVDDSLLEIVASDPKICPYFDFPVEHISDSILKRMGRRITKKQTIDKLQKIKETIPGAAIRTSIMTGFPGETEQDFTELADFISDGWFDHLGIFTYSPEEGTPALKFTEEVPPDLAQMRLETIMEIQREVSAGKNQLLLNSTLQVIVDGFTEEGRLFGRTEKQAPDVDGIVYLNGKAETGEIVPVVIKYTEDYDLYGDILPKDELNQK